MTTLSFWKIRMGTSSVWSRSRLSVDTAERWLTNAVSRQAQRSFKGPRGEEKMLGDYPIDVVLLAPDLEASKDFYTKRSV